MAAPCIQALEVQEKGQYLSCGAHNNFDALQGSDPKSGGSDHRRRAERMADDVTTWYQDDWANAKQELLIVAMGKFITKPTSNSHTQYATSKST